jgi:hypothetical protein
MHPTTTFGILIVGVLLCGLTYQVAASDYNVNAVVQAAPLQTGATITSPHDGTVVNTRPITVNGDCPDSSYVKLIRNGQFSGVAVCQNNTFAITTDLSVGANTLQAQAYNLTDQAGPQTSPITISYAPVATTPSSPAGGTNSSGASSSSSNTSTSSSTTSATASPTSTDQTAAPDQTFMFVTDYHFQVATTTEDFSWTMRYNAGVAPFQTTIGWGDGKKSSMVVPNNAEFTISHHYERRGYYPINITGVDAEHHTITIQLAAYVKEPGDPAIGSTSFITPTSTTINTPSKSYAWLTYAWPSYGVVAVVAASFWLGERREFLQLVGEKGPRRRLRHP